MTQRDERIAAAVHASGLPPQPWRNGAGVTREIAAAPGGGEVGFAWRLSLADLEADAPFSPFPGVERVHVPVQGRPYMLTVDGHERVARVGEPLRFSGGAEVAVALGGGGGRRRALNLMVAASAGTGCVGVIGPADTPMATGVEVVAVAVVEGAAELRDGRRLGPLDVLLTDGLPVEVTRLTGKAALVRVRPRRAAG